MKYTTLQLLHPQQTVEKAEELEATLNQLAVVGWSLHSTQYLPPIAPDKDQGYLLLIFEQNLACTPHPRGAGWG